MAVVVHTGSCYYLGMARLWAGRWQLREDGGGKWCVMVRRKADLPGGPVSGDLVSIRGQHYRLTRWLDTRPDGYLFACYGIPLRRGMPRPPPLRLEAKELPGVILPDWRPSR